MRKIKPLQLNWYRFLTIAFLVLLFAVSRVEAVYIPKDNGDISTFTTTFIEKAKTVGLNSFKDTTLFVKTTLNTTNDAIISSLDTYKDILSQAQLKSSSLASVGSSLSSISDGLAHGWATFTYGILDNITDSVIGTKEFAVSVFDGAKFIGNEIGSSFSSGFNSLSTSLSNSFSNSLSLFESKPKVVTETKVITPTVLPPKQEEVVLPTTTTIINQIAGTGPQGERGPVGPQGLEGPRGPKGEKGDTLDTSSFVLNSFLENQINRMFDGISDDIDSSSNRITEDGTLNDSILNRPILNNATGTLIGTLTGNADTVTNGLYSTGSYANPTWLTAIPYSILSGTVPTWNQDTTGNAGTVTNGIYSTGSYSDPLWLTISKSKVGLSNVDNTSDATKSVLYSASSGDSNLLDGNDSTYFYQASNPTGFITSSGTATNFSGSLTGDVTGTQGATVVGDDTHSHTAGTLPSSYTALSIGTMTGDVTGNAGTVTNGIYSTSSYANPTWLTAIPYSILSGTVPTWNQDTTGTATYATNVATTTKADAMNYYLTFVGANSSSNQGVAVGPATYNPSTDTITATTFTGALTGNSSTATKLETAKAINGVDFDGTAPITITADATTLTGTSLKSTVVGSSLTSVGTLTGLAVNGGYTQTGLTANTFTGTPTFSNATYSALFTGGKVGIGTTSPNFALTVTDGSIPEASAVGVSGPVISVQGDGKAYFMGRDVTNNIEFIMGTTSAGAAFAGSTTNHSMLLRTNNVTRTTIDTSGNLTQTGNIIIQGTGNSSIAGNVGIGTTGPGAKLQLSDSVNTYLNAHPDLVFDGTDFAYASGVGGHARIYSGTTSGSWADAYLRFQTHVGDVSTLTDTMTLKNGKVGIGTTAGPAGKLEVALTGTPIATSIGRISNYSDAAYLTYTGGLKSALVFRGSDEIGAAIESGRNNPSVDWSTYLSFYTRAANMAGNLDSITERVRIDSSGNVGIGTTTPSQLLSVGNSNQFTVSSEGTMVSQSAIIGVTSIAPIVVSGVILPSDANGIYSFGGQLNGKNYYQYGSYYIWWGYDSTYWILNTDLGNWGSNGEYYGSSANTPIFYGWTAQGFTGSANTTAGTLSNLTVNGTGDITTGGVLNITGTRNNYIFGSVGIGTTTPLSKLSINGGLHVGGDSDAGDDNILADGTITGTQLISNIATGTAPFTVISTTPVINLSIGGNAETVTSGVYTTGSYSDPSWLTLSKSKVGLGSVEDTALSTWAGTSNITTVGIINSGTWNGTAIGDTYIGSASTWNAKQNAISFGTNVLTALGVAIGTAGSPLVNGGVLGTPSSGTVTNLTGTAGININGTVGVTTPTTGAFTTIAASGGYTQSGTNANTFTGTPTFSNATYSALFTGGNVGIGTTAPGSKLSVYNATNVGTNTDGLANSILYLNNGTAADGSIVIKTHGIASGSMGALKFQVSPDGANYSEAAVKGMMDSMSVGNSVGLGFFTASSNASADVPIERMRINSLGNVGIGTTVPQGQLSMTSQVDQASTLLTYSVVDQNVLNGYYATPLYTRYFDIAAVGFPDGTNGASVIRFLTNPVTNGSSATEKMRIDGSGNVGIGTTVPAAPLHIGYDSSTVPGLLIGNGTMVTNYLSLSGGRGMVGYDPATFGNLGGALTLQVGSPTKGIIFRTNGTNGAFLSGNIAMAIDSSGNVGIGTAVPASKLQVAVDKNIGVPSDGIAGANLVQFSVGGSTDITKRLILGYDTTNNYGIIAASNSDAWQPIYFSPNTSTGIPNMVIQPAGNVGIGTTAPSDGSLEIARDVPAIVGSGTAQLILKGSTDGNKRLLLGFDTTSNYAFIQPLQKGTSWAGYNLALAPAGGNVGIGTATPGTKLDVNGSVRFSGSSNASPVDGELVYDLSAHAYKYYNNSTWLSLAGGTITSTGSFWAQNGTILSYTAGNVGIGTTSPGAKLDLLSTTEQLRISYDAANYTSFTAGSTGILGIVPKSGIYLFGNSGQADRSILVGSRTINSSSSVYGYNFDIHQTGTGAVNGINAFAYQESSTTSSAYGEYILLSAPTSGVSLRNLLGIRSIVKANSGATFTDGIYGIQSEISGDLGTITNSVKFINIYNAITSGVIPSMYGLYISSLTQGVENFAIYTNGTTKSYFGGYVGIGTTTPHYPLEVIGDANVTGALRLNINDYTGGVIPSYPTKIVSTANGSVAASNLLDFYVSNSNYVGATEALRQVRVMTLTGAGNVGIGTTDPGAKLEVASLTTVAADIKLTSGGVSGGISYNDSTQNLSIINYGNYSGNDPATTGIRFFTNGDVTTPKVMITRLGNVGIGTTTPGNILTIQQTSATDPVADAWTVYSSGRWKEHRVPIINALETINELNPVYFDWKAEYGGAHDLGFIAEEVGVIIPEVVAWEDNGVDAKSIDYARLSTIAIAGVKELNLKLENINTFEVDEEGNSIINTFRDNIISWFANVGNGIGDMYATVIHSDRLETKMLCVGDTCVTEDQFLEIVNKNVTTDVENNNQPAEKTTDEKLLEAENAAGLLSPDNYTNYSIMTEALALSEETEENKLFKITAINDAVAGLVLKEEGNQQPPALTAEELVAQEEARLAEIAEAERLAAVEAERLASEQEAADAAQAEAEAKAAASAAAKAALEAQNPPETGA